MLYLCLQLKGTTVHMHNECTFYVGIVKISPGLIQKEMKMLHLKGGATSCIEMIIQQHDICLSIFNSRNLYFNPCYIDIIFHQHKTFIWGNVIFDFNRLFMGPCYVHILHISLHTPTDHLACIWFACLKYIKYQNSIKHIN